MRLKTLFIAALASLTAFADSSKVSNGYYRVQNDYTKRYLYLMDDKGTVNYAAGTVECGAIVPYMNLERAIPDPASVIYIQQYSNGYIFYAQGTSTTKILNNFAIQLTAYKGGWLCWGSYGGLTKYLADNETVLSEEKGSVGTLEPNERQDLKKWLIHPVHPDSTNYFGIKPEFEIDGKYYSPFYASFPFKTYSTGMKVYKVKKQAEGKAVLVEVTEDVIPANSPVLIECSSNNPADNKLDIQMGDYTALSNNLLSGVFFRYGEDKPDDYRHKNVTMFNKATDRVFGKTAEGKLGMITPTEDYVPANTSYLHTAETNLPAEIEFVDEQEFDGIADVKADRNNGDDSVYNLQGMLVGKRSDNLKPGMYVVNGKKMIVR